MPKLLRWRRDIGDAAQSPNVDSLVPAPTADRSTQKRAVHLTLDQREYEFLADLATANELPVATFARLLLLRSLRKIARGQVL